MRLPTSPLALTIVSVISIAGCDPGATLQTEPISPSNATASYAEVIPYGNPSGAALDGFAQEHGAHLQEYGSLRAQLVDILEAESSTQEKTVRMQSILGAQSTSPLANYLQQFAAHRMLRAILDESRPSAANIGYYSDLLIRNENPDAELIHQALGHLTGEWSRERLAKAARATSVRAREWATRICTDCQGGKSQKSAANPGLMLKHQRILDAANKLDDFVGP